MRRSSAYYLFSDKKKTAAFQDSMSILSFLPRMAASKTSSGPLRRKRYLVLAIILLVIFYLVQPSPEKFVVQEQYREEYIPPPISSSTAVSIQARFPTESQEETSTRLNRQSQIKEAFTHAWQGYKKHAWLHDEVTPLSGSHTDPFVGWAATLVDSLDTLWIMGMVEEFEAAVKAVGSIHFTKPKAERVPVFETTIRYLGGLLGAYDVSDQKYPLLLQKATELGDFLFQAFHTVHGIPVPYYWWEKKTPKGEMLKGENGVLLAQIFLSMEFTRLSQLTGDGKYARVVQKVTDQLEVQQNETALPGMWPSQVDYKTNEMHFMSRAFTLGAWAGKSRLLPCVLLDKTDFDVDSAYEYLPKTHLLLRQSVSPPGQYLSMYKHASPVFSKNLFFRPRLPGNPDILFPGSLTVAGDSHRFEAEIQHLGCFVGGMVGLASRIENSAEGLSTAEKLTNGCVWAYDNTPSGIMPEVFLVDKCDSGKKCTWTGEGTGYVRVRDSSYQLRPEAIESVFIMYRLTRDKTWQEKAWKMFTAIQNHTRTDIANARLEDVMEATPKRLDSMESFWLAETLKYFYLIFSEDSLVNLDEFVLNTEAHPFRYRDPR